MHSTTKFIGLDVSKETIAVAIAEVGQEAPRYYGSIAHTPAALRKLIRALGSVETLSFCYEA
ncbi:IS110 family transposase, partial [Paenibacillaceae sp. P-15]